MASASLQSRIAGEVVSVTDAIYEQTRRDMVWNQLTPARRPSFIVRVRCEDDVVETVRFAREHGHRISIRSGGHNWWGSSLRDGSILLDLEQLDAVSVDASARTASVQPAVRGRDLSRVLDAKGLAFPCGHCGAVAVGGYLLSGGFGWNSGAWGPACFSVEAIDVVTADGRMVQASAERNADLLWAARGAGPGFFGVVTRYHLKVYPRPHTILSSNYTYPLACLGQVGEWATELSRTLPRTVELGVLLAAAPPAAAPRCKEESGRACTILATAFAESEAEAIAALAPLESSPIIDQCLVRERNVPTPYDTLFDNLDNLYPQKHRFLAEAIWSDTAAATLLPKLRSHLVTAPSSKSHVLAVLPLPPPPDAPPPPDVAFSMTAAVILLCYSIWEEPAGDAANRAWHEQMVATLEPFAVGNYIGECNLADRPTQAQRSFAPANWQRLQALRQQYDPHGLFRGYFDPPHE